MRRAVAAMLLVLLTSCYSVGAFDLALQTAHDVAGRAAANEQVIDSTCSEANRQGVPYASERCEAARNAYDRVVVAVNELIAVLETAKQAKAMGRDVDEGALLRAELVAEKAMRDLDAAMGALFGGHA